MRTGVPFDAADHEHRATAGWRHVRSAANHLLAASGLIKPEPLRPDG